MRDQGGDRQHGAGHRPASAEYAEQLAALLAECGQRRGAALHLHGEILDLEPGLPHHLAEIPGAAADPIGGLGVRG